MPKKAAEQLRVEWGLGQDPIPNVVAMLEENGYKVVEVTADKDFDGMKAFAGAVRVIVVNRTHMTSVASLHGLARTGAPCPLFPRRDAGK